MTIHLFIGPTMPREEIAGLEGVVCLPPVAQGDVLRSVKARPQAIGIVDGYFDGVPAVWHKEILWALTQGIHVFGSASMGALRAAELHRFGMRGVGRIFEGFRDGALEDDDEVAVLHGPAETGYVSLSEPLVNIRATLEEAERAGIIGPDARATLIERAKKLFYQERAWERLLTAVGADLHVHEKQALQSWLSGGRIDQKRLDAREMIIAMRALLDARAGPMRATFQFEWTDMGEATTRSPTPRAAVDGGPETRLPDDWVLDELRLDEAAFDAVRQRAMLRSFAAGARRSHASPEPAVRRAAEQRLRARLALFRRAEVDRWCVDNGLEPGDFARLVDDEARLAELEARLEPDLRNTLLDQLRLDGAYAGFAARAREKQAVLARCGGRDAAPADVGMTPIQLAVWHFESRLGRSLPDDIGAYARRFGLATLADFYRLLLREWLYCGRGQVGADRK